MNKARQFLRQDAIRQSWLVPDPVPECFPLYGTYAQKRAWEQRQDLLQLETFISGWCRCYDVPRDMLPLINFS